MADLYITEQNTTLNKSGDALHVRVGTKKIFEIPIKNIDTIHVFGHIQITTQLLDQFFEHGIELSYYTIYGKLKGQITPIYAKNSILRKKQYELSTRSSFCLEFSKAILHQKFINSIQRLKIRFKKNRYLPIQEEIQIMKNQIIKLKQATDIPELMGIEGNFAKTYFHAYSKLFKNPILFNGRSKRPPKDEANSILSFVYVLLTNKIMTTLNGAGIDPYIGYLHTLDYGRASLACDLLEPIRARFCDRFVVNLFNKNLLSKNDFEQKEEGFYLKPLSLKKFFLEFGQELKAERNFGIIKGNFTDFLKEINIWLRDCIESGKIHPMKTKPKEITNG